MGLQRVGHGWATELNWTDDTRHSWYKSTFRDLLYIVLEQRSRKLVLQIPECVWGSVLQTRLSSCPTTNVSQLPLFFPFFSPSFLPPSLPPSLPSTRQNHQSLLQIMNSFLHSLITISFLFLFLWFYALWHCNTWMYIYIHFVTSVNFHGEK